MATGNAAAAGPSATPRYRGRATVTSSPRRASADDTPSTASASPPVFANGSASEATTSTRMALGLSLVHSGTDRGAALLPRGRRADGVPADRLATPRPATCLVSP